MNKEFVPYDIALAMKELGFDEMCVGHYQTFEGNVINFDTISTEVCERLCKKDNFIKAPLYQQAFRWIQENSFNEDGDSLVQDYLDTRWFRILYSPVHQDITLKECIRIFKEIVNQKKDDEK